jgi:hypothetical protein
MSDEVTMPVASIEMQEYLFAETLVKIAAKCEAEKKNVTEWDALKREIRTCFRFQRFAVMNWLMMNDVSVPARLLTDQCHPPVGRQFPDHQRPTMRS